MLLRYSHISLGEERLRLPHKVMASHPVGTSQQLSSSSRTHHTNPTSVDNPSVMAMGQGVGYQAVLGQPFTRDSSFLVDSLPGM